jgi:hypothetical protein
VNVIGPFNLTNVMVSTKLDLSGAKYAMSNGHWNTGVFYLGTKPTGGDVDSEGLGARFHVGSNITGSYGFVADKRANAPWHLWVRDSTSYYKSCAEVNTAGQAGKTHTLDPDGPGGNPPVQIFCPASPLSPAPVGLCQAEVGASPACNSYVGAAGFNFSKINFAGKMTLQAGYFKVGSTTIKGNRGIIQLANGAVYSLKYATSAAMQVSSTGTYATFGSGLSNPHGILQLFNKNILIGDHGKVARIFTPANVFVSLFGQVASWPTQMASGEVWTGAGTELWRMDLSGKLLSKVTHASFHEGVTLVIQLADGRYLASFHGKVYPSVPGRVIFLDSSGTPMVPTKAPAGMTLTSNGSFYHKDFSGQHEVIQLPNEMILIASYWTDKLVRLNKDGSYVDSLTLGTGCAGNGCGYAPSGLMLTKDGKLVMTTGNNTTRVVTFGP